MNQLRYKINESAPFDVLFTPNRSWGQTQCCHFTDKVPGFTDASRYYNLDSVLTNVVASDDPKYNMQSDNGTPLNIVPTHKFQRSGGHQYVRSNGTVHEGDSVISELHVEMPAEKRYLLKNDLAILGLIARNKWKRPICFTSPQDLGDLAFRNM